MNAVLIRTRQTMCNLLANIKYFLCALRTCLIGFPRPPVYSVHLGHATRRLPSKLADLVQVAHCVQTSHSPLHYFKLFATLADTESSLLPKYT